MCLLYKQTLDCRPLIVTVIFLEGSSKNIKLPKFLSHGQYLLRRAPLSASASLTPFQTSPICASVCVYVKASVIVACTCVSVICQITAVYSRDFSHGSLVYLLYLQYNASVNISNFETQVSISYLEVVCACPCVCSARCREEMNTTAKEAAWL